MTSEIVLTTRQRADERSNGRGGVGGECEPARANARGVDRDDGRGLYTTNERPVQSSGGTLSKLDAATRALVWEVPIGNRPSEVLVTPNARPRP